jgi:hypothetical protein
LKLEQNTVASTTVSVHSNEIQPAPTPATLITQTTPTPHTVMQINTDVSHLLCNNSSRDSNSLPSQVVIDGRTYTLSYIVTVLTTFIKICRDLAVLSLMELPIVDLFDLTLLYSLKPSILLLTILYRKSLSALLLALFKHSMVPSLVNSINIPTMAMSPSCVTLAPSLTTLLVNLVGNSVYKL